MAGTGEGAGEWAGEGDNDEEEEEEEEEEEANFGGVKAAMGAGSLTKSARKFNPPLLSQNSWPQVS